MRKARVLEDPVPQESFHCHLCLCMVEETVLYTLLARCLHAGQAVWGPLVYHLCPETYIMHSASLLQLIWGLAQAC